MENIIKLIVNKSDNETRVDLFVKKKKKELSRTRIKNLILNKNLKINNIIVKNPSKNRRELHLEKKNSVWWRLRRAKTKK